MRALPHHFAHAPESACTPTRRQGVCAVPSSEAQPVRDPKKVGDHWSTGYPLLLTTIHKVTPHKGKSQKLTPLFISFNHFSPKHKATVMALFQHL